jgi:asparagine synthase (glutamine-hydrolysing)
MCGIAGFEPRGERDQEVATRLGDALASRGPNGTWSERRERAWLVQTRLAVIDLSPAVRYPMPNEAGDVWLLYNGEIYNHAALRSELRGRGHSFHTRCDAEVVVHGYEEWGDALFARLNGMFALAIVDERGGDLVLARDRFGIKPLVRTTSGPFAFASTATALLRAGLCAPEVDEQAVREFLALHYVPPPHTGLAGVEEVLPGTLLRRGRDGRETTQRWAAQPLEEPGDPVPVDTVEAVVGAAVERQLVADVEVGVFLSGGIDSSLVLSFAAEQGARPQAFTLSFPGYGDYDEADAAATAAGHYGVRHHRIPFNSTFGEAIEGVGAAFDQPFADSSAIPTLALATYTAEHVRVALSGTGGDDLFGGYYRHRAHRLRPLLTAVPHAVAERLSSPAGQGGDERRSGVALMRSYARRLVSAGGSGDVAQYLGLIGGLTSPSGLGAVRLDVDARTIAGGLAARYGLREGAPGSTLRRLQEFELATYLPGDLLRKEDRATMAVGLEARVPLLDDELVRLAATMPEAQKIGWTSGKRALRELARRRLPRSISAGRKRGFAFPLGALFRGDWRAEAADWFSSQPGRLVDGPAAAHLVLGGGAPAADLWALAVLARWESGLGEHAAAAPGGTPLIASGR